MPYIVADRVKETTTVTGTGPATLAGAASGYRSFASQLSIGDTCAYVIVNANASEWETGIGTYSAVNTLTRTTIHASTNANAAVVFTAGVKDVFMGPTANTILSDVTSTDGSVTINQTGTISDLSVAVAAATTNVIVQVRNNTGAILTKGTVVYINSAVGQTPTVAKALATSDATSAQTLGMLSADLGINAVGPVTIIGLIDDVNTGAYQDGDQLYLSSTTAGQFTATKPYAPAHLVYVGVVEYAHAVHGKIFVKVQNGYELDELHNVAAQSPSNGQTIVYNSTSQLWEKNTVSLTAGVNGTLPVANGGTGVTTSTGTGSVVLSNTPTLVTPQTNAINAVPVVSGAGNNLTFTAGSGVTSGAGGSLILQAGVQATTGGDGKVVVKQVAGQTSNLQEWQDSTAGIKVFVDSSGNIGTGLNAYSNRLYIGPSVTSYLSGGSQSMGLLMQGNQQLSIYAGSSESVRFFLNSILIRSGHAIAWCADIASASINTALTSDGSAALAQRNGTNAQTFRVYNTYTDASNYERLGISWASNICTISPENAGTGSPRALTLATPSLGTTGTVPALSLVAGNGTVTGAKGGSINITAGNGGSGNGGGGGSVTIAAGVNVADNTQPPGNITITAGQTGGAAQGGSVTIQGGTSSAGGAPAGGTVNILGGAQGTPGNVGTASGTGSVVVKSPDSNALMGGVATSLANPTGNVSIATGNGGTIAAGSTQPTITTGSSGTISISTGAGGSATVVGTTRNAGSSGTITISTNAGGNASGGTTNNGGSSGSIIIGTGVAGTGSTSNGTVGTIQFNVGGINTANVLSTGLGSNAVTAIPLPTAATVTAATGNGTTVTYTAANTFSVGQVVSITGLTITTGSSLNLSNQTITTASATQFTVANTTSGTAAATQAGTATIQSAGNSVTITAGNGSGVGAGGNIILQPGAQGTSGGNGSVSIGTSTTFKWSNTDYITNIDGSGFVFTSGNAARLGLSYYSGYYQVSIPGTLSILPNGSTINLGNAYVTYQTLEYGSFGTIKVSQGRFGGYGIGTGFSFPSYTQNIGSSLAITNKSLTGNVATLTTSTPHKLIYGQVVAISGVDATFDGTYTVTNPQQVSSYASLTTFSYTKTAADVASQAATGTATVVLNDINLGPSPFVRINTQTAQTITGLIAPFGYGAVNAGVHLDGRMIRIYNVGTANLTLSHNSASSTAANRMFSSTGADIILAPNDYAELIYDATSNGSGAAGWRMS